MRIYSQLLSKICSLAESRNVSSKETTSTNKYYTANDADCLLCRHYPVLHNNVVRMALALDNYPTGLKDPHDALKLFPDDIMRKDVLDELQPPGQTALPKAPPPPACPKCAFLRVTVLSKLTSIDDIQISN